MLFSNKLKTPAFNGESARNAELFDSITLKNLPKIPLVIAPTGYGKTVFVQQLVTHKSWPTVWYALDSHDDNAIFFWRYMVTLFHQFDDRLGKHSQALLNTSDSENIQDAIMSLIEDLNKYSRLWNSPDILCLVIDNIHVISDPTLLAQMDFFLNQIPPFVRCFLIGQSVPALSIEKRIARGEALTYGIQFLKLGAAETGGFLEQRLNQTIRQEHIDLIHQKTEGWIMALELFAVIVNESPTALPKLLKSPSSHPLISDFLRHEVIQQSDERFADMLTLISFLPRYCPRLIAAMLDKPSAKRLMLKLFQQPLLCMTVEGETQWHRMHSLLKEWLNQQASESFFADQQETLTRAIIWFNDQGYHLEALRLAAMLSDWALVVSVTENAVSHFIRNGQYQMADQILDEVPTQNLDNSIKISFFKLFIECNRHPSPVLIESFNQTKKKLDHYKNLEEHLLIQSEFNSPEQVEEMFAVAQLLCKHIHHCLGIIEETENITAQACHILTRHKSPFVAWAWQNLAIQDLENGNLKAAKQHLTKAIHFAQLNRDGICFFICISMIIPIMIRMGMLSTGLKWLTHWESWTIEHDFQGIPQSTNIHTARLLIYLSQNKLQEAAQCQQYIASRLNELDPISQIYTQYTIVMFHLAGKNLLQAGIAVDELESIYHCYFQHWNFYIPTVDTLRSLIDFIQGNPVPLMQWADRFSNHPPAINHPGFQVEEDIYLLVQVYRSQDISVSLAKASEQAQQQGNRRRDIYLDILTALQAQQAGKKNTAAKVLSRALTKAAPLGLVRIFIDVGPAIIPILQQVKPSHDYQVIYASILGAFNGTPLPQESLAQKQTPISLSTREQQVLASVAAGKSNEEISADLAIALSTVKTHLIKIYRKLNVTRRTQAIDVAREYGWLV